LATTNDITISPKQSNQRHDMHSGYQSSARLKGQLSSNSAFIRDSWSTRSIPQAEWHVLIFKLK